jgi:hypothetical protein
MGPPLGGRASPFTLHRIASVLPVGQPTQVAADIAVAVGGERIEGGHRVLAVVVGGVQDDLVVAAQLPQRPAGAGVADRAGDVAGPVGPAANRHDQLDVGAGIQLGLELLSGDRLHRSLLSVGMTYPDDPLTWRVVSVVHHRQAVMCSTCDVATGRNTARTAPHSDVLEAVRSPMAVAPSGSGAARTGGALRAIDSFQRSRSWRTCGSPAFGENLGRPGLLLGVVQQDKGPFTSCLPWAGAAAAHKARVGGLPDGLIMRALCPNRPSLRPLTD